MSTSIELEILNGVLRALLRGRDDEAVALVDRALQSGVAAPKMLQARGIALARLGQFEEAVRSLAGELRRDPGDVGALSALLEVLDAALGTKLHLAQEERDPGREPAAPNRCLPGSWGFLLRHPPVRLYAGDVPAMKEYDGWVGLSITHGDDRHILHDITMPLPLPDDCVDGFQAEDVFEHILYSSLPPVLDEIFRVLKPGTLFRLSVPDYRCDLLVDRSMKDAQGHIVFDPLGGGTPENPGHLWFPRYETVRTLLDGSPFARQGTITFLHCYRADGAPVTNPIDYSRGHVLRTPDFDERVRQPYRPLSLVVDLVKR